MTQKWLFGGDMWYVSSEGSRISTKRWRQIKVPHDTGRYQRGLALPIVFPPTNWARAWHVNLGIKTKQTNTHIGTSKSRSWRQNPQLGWMMFLKAKVVVSKGKKTPVILVVVCVAVPDPSWLSGGFAWLSGFFAAGFGTKNSIFGPAFWQSLAKNEAQKLRVEMHFCAGWDTKLIPGGFFYGGHIGLKKHQKIDSISLMNPPLSFFFRCVSSYCRLSLVFCRFSFVFFRFLPFRSLNLIGKQKKTS